MSETKTGKWTYWRLTSEMRRAGWQNAGRGIYIHDNCPGYQLQLFSFDTVNRCEIWHQYADNCAAPNPEDFC